MRHNNWALLAIAITIIGLSVTTTNIYADSTGATSPTDAISGVASINDFTSRTSAFVSDDADAVGTSGDDQAYGDFGLAIPTGSAINGITVSLEGSKEGTFFGFECGDLVGSPTMTVILSDPTLVGDPTGTGSFVGDSKTTTSFAQSVDSIKLLGSTTDTWSNTYTAEQLANLWVLVTTNCGSAGTTLHLDHLTVDVDFTAPEEEEEDDSKNGNDDNKWRTKPTFGISPTSKSLVVDCGFGIDQTCYDMTDEWYTPFDKVIINTGEKHNFQLNAMAQMRLKNAGFCLVPQIGSMEGELCIGVTLDGNGNLIGTEINQDEPLVDESAITFAVTRDGAFYNIRINNVMFIDQPFFQVIGLYGTDYQPRIVNTFLNEGIGVVGESFVEQPTIKIASNEKTKYGDSGSITLTRVDKFENLWTTYNGILYTFNDHQSPIKVTQEGFKRFQDTVQNVMTRKNSNFQYMIDYSTAQADKKMREMYPELFREVEFAELGNIFSHDIVQHERIKIQTGI